MDELAGTLTSLTQLHVPEHEHLYVVIIKTPHWPINGNNGNAPSRVGEPCRVSEATLRDASRPTTSELELD
jgi:hypothetical protein